MGREVREHFRATVPDGVIAIDVERLSRTERLDEGATRTPAALEFQTASVSS